MISKLLPDKSRNGIRLFHLFSVQKIEELGKCAHIYVVETINISAENKSRGIFT
jgi:hypothetical protein